MNLEIINRILELLGDREQRELTSYLGLKAFAFSEWKSGKSKSYRKYLIEIAEFFNVSIDYLVYGQKVNPGTDEKQLSDGEKECLKYYRLLTAIDRIRIIEHMAAWYENYPHPNTETKEKEIAS